MAVTLSKEFILIRGDYGGVDWKKINETIIAIAHSHPLNEEKRLMNGKDIDQIIKGEDAIRFFPSYDDLGYCYNEGIDEHTVHTPYTYLGEGYIDEETIKGLPSVSLLIQNITINEEYPDFINLILYQAKITAFPSNENKSFWSGKILFTPMGGKSTAYELLRKYST